MRIGDQHHRTIWVEADEVFVLDQTALPHAVRALPLRHLADAAHAIRTMQVRGAPCIGATAAFGVALAMRDDPSDAGLERSAAALLATRPTAVNLRWAVGRLVAVLREAHPARRADVALAEAQRVADEDVATCRAIGEHGLHLLRAIAATKPGRPVNVLTHCNAGWLATVDWGTATAPIYLAHDEGLPVHVWVDETRPRNQGAALTAFELAAHGVPHTLIVDNAGGHFMQRGQVDVVIVGTDRTAANGDVANKIGTYLKALAAHDNGVPFYVALPHSTIDWQAASGDAIPIEARDEDEVLSVEGRCDDGEVRRVALTGGGTRAANPAFDVTPARLVTGLITERGVCAASTAGLRGLYPDQP